jgi:hypothetical protein
VSASRSPTGTTRPAFVRRTIRDAGPTSVATTGTPIAIARKAVGGIAASVTDDERAGNTQTSLAATYTGTRSGSVAVRKVSRPPATARPA